MSLKLVSLGVASLVAGCCLPEQPGGAVAITVRDVGTGEALSKDVVISENSKSLEAHPSNYTCYDLGSGAGNPSGSLCSWYWSAGLAIGKHTLSVSAPGYASSLVQVEITQEHNYLCGTNAGSYEEIAVTLAKQP